MVPVKGAPNPSILGILGRERTSGVFLNLVCMFIIWISEGKTFVFRSLGEAHFRPSKQLDTGFVNENFQTLIFHDPVPILRTVLNLQLVIYATTFVSLSTNSQPCRRQVLTLQELLYVFSSILAYFKDPFEVVRPSRIRHRSM